MTGYSTARYIAGLLAAAAIVASLGGCTATTPIGSLADNDRTQRSAARAEALERNRTGEATNWNNPETGSRGTVVPTRTYKSPYGEDCREFQETVTAGNETDILTGVACRRQSGGWRIIRGPFRRSAYDPYDPYWPYGSRYGYYDYWGRPHFRSGMYFGGW